MFLPIKAKLQKQYMAVLTTYNATNKVILTLKGNFDYAIMASNKSGFYYCIKIMARYHVFVS